MNWQKTENDKRQTILPRSQCKTIALCLHLAIERDNFLLSFFHPMRSFAYGLIARECVCFLVERICCVNETIPIGLI